MFRSVARFALVLTTLSAGTAASADTVAYTVDPARSRLVLSGAVRAYHNGSVWSFNPVATGSMEAAFGGSITGEHDGSSLTLSGGSSILALANPAGPFAPPGPGSVDVFGMRTFANAGSVADNRMYDLTLDLLSGVLSDGSAFSGIVAYSGNSGGIFPFFDPAPLALAGAPGNNTAPGLVSLSSAGVVETLTIPINANLRYARANGTGVETRLTGSIVATRIIPSPGAPAALAIAATATLRRRR